MQCALREIADIMHADGALLTMHAEGSAPTLLDADHRLHDRAADTLCLELLAAVRPDFDEGHSFWREDGKGGALLLMPIERVANHSQLVLSVYFRGPTADQRAGADRIHRERRPMAIGFFRLWQKNRLLQQRIGALEAVVDRTAVGVLLINRAGEPVFVNETAEEILAGGDGLGRAGHGIRATHLADGVHLHAALSHAIGMAGQGPAAAAQQTPVLAFRRKHGQPLIASVIAAAATPVEQNDVAATMYLTDPDIDWQWMLSPICKLHGLSQVETALVCQLAGGRTLTDAAQAIRVKEQTARGYLKTIFVKTGTKRQVDLIVLLLSSVIRTRRKVQS